MASLNQVGFLTLAVVFHIAYIFSIFDIYFVSPIVTGMHLIPVDQPPGRGSPAERLVLFVGDGLRADKAFQSFPEPYPQSEKDFEPRPLAPYLRSRVLKHGTFGVSHTRVPTESRPGHVALIAGLYEDVSSVTTGWKVNPVVFDSVFNRSRHTWSWGSPDILTMFEKGAVPGRVDAYTYDANMEDFSLDATHLDHWVFDNVREHFALAASDKHLDTALRQNKIVLFLHLLGLDTTGHSYRPYSNEYLNNIKVVDHGIEEIVNLIESFYGDGKTAFIFTADHGMSDWGSHGDGHPDNTRTPLIAWGSGIAPPILTPGSVAPGHDSYSADWGLDHVQRHDVSQADIAALMAHIIGVEFPANSVGELPLSYLSAGPKDKAAASLVNARAILEMYRVKEEKKKATQLGYRPYRPLSDHGVPPKLRVERISNLLLEGDYNKCIAESATLIKICLEGLRYLQTYDWLFLRALITVGYLGWIVFAITIVIDLHVLHGDVPPSRNPQIYMIASATLALMYACFFIAKSPVTYYFYALFPVGFWTEVLSRRDSLTRGGGLLFKRTASSGSTFSMLLNTFIFVGVLISLAFGYIHREVLTTLYAIGAFWPCIYGVSFLQEFAYDNVAWLISCLVMSTFTLLPALKVENIMLVLAGGGAMVFVGISYLVLDASRYQNGLTGNRKTTLGSRQTFRVLLGIQVGLVILAMVVTHSSVLSLQAKRGLPRGNQVVGWIVLVTSLFMPLAHRAQPSPHYIDRLIIYFLTFAPTFVILTISFEGLFFVAFSATLFFWVQLEDHIQIFRHSSRQVEMVPHQTVTAGATIFRPLSLPDARVALFFFVFLQSAFFSTGNIASVSSFSLDSVYRLIPLFDPFSQGALLLLKLMIPFALISANLGVLNRKLRVAPSALFMVVMAISDILTLYFFWVVKDEGSWLEIGSTISHFVIASLLCIFVALLEGVSTWFIAGIQVEDRGSKKLL